MRQGTPEYRDLLMLLLQGTYGVVGHTSNGARHRLDTWCWRRRCSGELDLGGTGAKRLVLCGHRGHKAIAMAVERLNEPLATPRISKRFADRSDAGFQRCIADELLGPQM